MASTLASAQELKQVIRQKLLDSDDVYDIVEDRVFGNHLQTPDIGSVDFPLVIIEFYLGDAAIMGGYQEVILELWCYDRVWSAEALKLYDACYRALQHTLLSVSGIATKGFCTEMNRPTEGFNDMPRAYFARGRWRARAGIYGD